MTEKSAVTPSAISVQIKEKAPLDLAIVPPTPAPFMWMTGTTNPRRVMTYPDRLSASSLHTLSRLEAATRPYQKPESFIVRFWLRKSV
jgi:hypothetical protein